MMTEEQNMDLNLRMQCLQYALGLHPEGATRNEVIETAELFYQWLKPITTVQH